MTRATLVVPSLDLCSAIFDHVVPSTIETSVIQEAVVPLGEHGREWIQFRVRLAPTSKAVDLRRLIFCHEGKIDVGFYSAAGRWPNQQDFVRRGLLRKERAVT